MSVTGPRVIRMIPMRMGVDSSLVRSFWLVVSRVRRINAEDLRRVAYFAYQRRPWSTIVGFRSSRLCRCVASKSRGS